MTRWRPGVNRFDATVSQVPAIPADASPEETEMSHHTAGHRDPSMNDCIQACTDCHAVCLETISHCLEQGGLHAAHEHIALMATCADICRTSADAMLRGTYAHVHTCRACAEICRLCAESCARMSDDADMQRCAEACRRCAESCERMAQG
jgi:hypothetical protein